jgi:hypothetical protein
MIISKTFFKDTGFCGKFYITHGGVYIGLNCGHYGIPFYHAFSSV